MKAAPGASRLATAEAPRWPAPAKLNLFLHVTGRRADGYHELQTLFQLIDLADEITFTMRQDGQIERSSGAAGVAAEADLVVRAARALQAATGTRLGATIGVHKRIPLGGGLGGGRRRRNDALGPESALGLRPVADRAGRPGATAGCGCACFH